MVKLKISPNQNWQVWADVRKVLAEKVGGVKIKGLKVRRKETKYTLCFIRKFIIRK